MHLPVYIGIVLFSLIYMGLTTLAIGYTLASSSLVPLLLVYSISLLASFVIGYYSLKQMFTSLYVFKEEFETDYLPLIGVVLLWYIITFIVIYNYDTLWNIFF